MPLRVHRRTALPAALLALAVGLTGCSATSQLEEFNQVQQGDARPAESPQVANPVEGEVVPALGTVLALVAIGDLVAAQVDDPPGLEIGRVDGTRWIPETTVDLPAGAGLASPGHDGTVLVPYGDGVVVVTPAGDARTISGLGPVTAAAVTADGRILTGDPDGDVVVRDAEGVEQNRVTGLNSVDRISVARDGSVTALSRPDTIIARIDPGETGAGPLLRAGKGAGMLAAFGEGTVVASDTVGGTLLVYSTSPIRLHQQFPVAAAPWAVAGDDAGGLVWVTSTGTNTVQAYDLGDGIGVRRADIATVRQPDSLVVTESGTVVVGSSDGEGLHLIRPTLSAPPS
ncbi:MAG TPA: hypothetical protein PKC36_07935 [Dietzia sp.]|nr:hypothetical protein [Dietzia sp.]